MYKTEILEREREHLIGKIFMLECDWLEKIPIDIDGVRFKLQHTTTAGTRIRIWVIDTSVPLAPPEVTQ
jgi:hypothetical protein